MSFSSDYIRDPDGGGDLNFAYRESTSEKNHVTVAEFKVKAAQTPGTRAQYAAEKPEMSIEYGDFNGKSELHQIPEITICRNREELRQLCQFRLSTVDTCLYGGETPIYLAKLDFAAVGGIYMLRNVTSHPFAQRLEARESASAGPFAGRAPGESSLSIPDVSTEVEALKYWQKPEVTSEISDNRLLFRFGIPSSEAYDYATAAGIVEIPMTGALRVGARFVSAELQHTLGLGNVSISLSAAYGPGDNQRLLFGNGEVFGGKNSDKEVPKVQLAAILFPDKGTFQVGAWCHDHVEGQSLRVHWFAMKTTRDTAEVRAADKVSVKITPDIHKTKVRKTVHFKATVTGSSDKEVIWSLAEANSGAINQNGIYKTPSTPGTYEVTARSAADQTAQTSAFVIVED
jgi:hypothetical protein